MIATQLRSDCPATGPRSYMNGPRSWRNLQKIAREIMRQTAILETSNRPFQNSQAAGR